MLGLETAGQKTLLEQMHENESSSALPGVGATAGIAKYSPRLKWLNNDNNTLKWLNKENKKPRSSMKIRSWIVDKNKARPEWSKYLQKVHGLIWVVDSADTRKLTWDEDEEWEGTVKDKLFETLEHPLLKNIPLLIFANKQDLNNALSATTIARTLEISPGSKISWNAFVNNCGFESCLNERELLQCIYSYLPGIPEGLNDFGEKREIHVEGCCAVTGEGFWEGLLWLEGAVARFEKAKSPSSPRSPLS